MTAPEKELATLHPALNRGMRNCQRHITTIDVNGVSVFANASPELLYCDRGGYGVAWNFATNQFPAVMQDDQDLRGFLTDDRQSENSHVYTGSRLILPNGLTFVTSSFAPDVETVMHRTTSLDLVTVVEGELELQLDSGEKRLLQAGVSHALPLSLYEAC